MSDNARCTKAGPPAPVKKRRTLWPTLLAACLLLGLATPGLAGLLSAQIANDLLVPSRQESLDFTPVAVVYASDGASFFVAGNPPAGERGGDEAGLVVEFDSRDLQPLREFKLPHSVEVLEIAPSGDRLVAAGNFSEPSVGGVSSVSLGDGAIATLRLRERLLLPSVSLAISGKAYLSHSQSNRIMGIPSALFERAAAVPGRVMAFEALPDDSYYFDAKNRIRQIVVSEEDSAIFVMPDDETKIYAMELQGFGRIIGDAGYSNEKRSTSVPLAAVGARVESEEYPEGKMSFLLADHQLGAILLQEYDPKFRTIDLITIANVGHELVPGTRIEFVPDTRSVRQPMLIASDRSQTKILSGNIYSRQLVIFARKPGAGYLERMATLQLDDPPAAIAVSPEGGEAIVLFGDRPAMLRLADPDRAPDIGEWFSTGGKTPVQITGDETVRELQKILTKLGFPVGSIDGLLGRKTSFSLNLAAEKYDLKSDPRDLDTIIKELQAVGKTVQ